MKRIFLVFILCLFLSGCEKAMPTGNFSHKVMREMPMPSPYKEDELKNKIIEITDNAVGDWSAYTEIPNEDFIVEVNNKNVRSASVIKMFNMATLFNEEQKGSFQITGNIYNTCYEMITVSSNTASNAIVEKIGNGSFEKGARIVTEFAHSEGCADTQEEHPLYDVSGPGSGINTTSVRDCGVFLKKLYNKNLVSQSTYEEMLGIMKEQTRNLKIPSTLPKDTVIAHKTGENSKVELDVGIVYSPATDYILCISVTDFNGSEIHSTFGKISKTIYDYYNKKTVKKL